MMTRVEVLQALSALTREQEVRWMLALGADLTISARASYVPGEVDANAAELMGYNEIQHQIYGRLLQLGDNIEWTAEGFVDILLAKARAYKIEGGLGNAVRRSLSSTVRAATQKIPGERSDKGGRVEND